MNFMMLLMPWAKKHMPKLGDVLFDMDKQTGCENVSFLITKKKGQDGKTICFLSAIEKPKPEHLIYAKDPQGEPIVMPIENLLTFLSGSNVELSDD